MCLFAIRLMIRICIYLSYAVDSKTAWFVMLFSQLIYQASSFVYLKQTLSDYFYMMLINLMSTFSCIFMVVSLYKDEK